MAIITNQTITDYYNDLCNRWGYTSTDNMSTGYESVMPRLRQLSKEVWLKADDAGKVQIEEEVFNIYRSVNIIPIHYYNLNGCREQLLELSTKQKLIENKILGVGNNEGLTFGRQDQTGCPTEVGG